MGLLDMLLKRDSLPGSNESQRIQGGGGVSPMRGMMPWNSGFQDYQQGNVMPELLRVQQMRQAIAEWLAKKNAIGALAPHNKR